MNTQHEFSHFEDDQEWEPEMIGNNVVWCPECDTAVEKPRMCLLVMCPECNETFYAPIHSRKL